VLVKVLLEINGEPLEALFLHFALDVGGVALVELFEGRAESHINQGARLWSMSPTWRAKFWRGNPLARWWNAPVPRPLRRGREVLLDPLEELKKHEGLEWFRPL
jgi:hypothetical protein